MFLAKFLVCAGICVEEFGLLPLQGIMWEHLGFLQLLRYFFRLLLQHDNPRSELWCCASIMRFAQCLVCTWLRVQQVRLLPLPAVLWECVRYLQLLWRSRCAGFICHHHTPTCLGLLWCVYAQLQLWCVGGRVFRDLDQILHGLFGGWYPDISR